MNAVSHGEPISWLLLERYALGELGEDERRAIEARLAASPEDRACLESILADDTELPPLPVVVPIKRRRPLVSAGLGVGLLAAAAALLLVTLGGQETLPPSARMLTGVKGGEVALVLVSESRGEHPTTFEEGEHFKLLVTCPPGFDKELRPIVFQAGARYEPLPRTPDFECGNRVPWPGAFALDGASVVEVCLGWERSAEGAERAAQLGEYGVCTRLNPR